MKRLIPPHNKVVWCAERTTTLGSVIMLGITFAVADMGCDDRDYDNWLTTLTGASARLDDLQTAVTEVRSLCEGGGVDSEQILKVLERHGV